MSNPVMFVSLGPGDPELITLKALKEMQSADVIFCPSVTHGGKTTSRAKDILVHLNIDMSKIELFGVSMKRDRAFPIESYKEAASSIIQAYRSGKRVAVTSEGDAGFYSTIFYISEYLEAENIPVGRIAGVPAFIASGTLGNIHIVKQKEELQVIPGDITSEDLIDRLKIKRTVVIMKASLCQQAIKDAMQTNPDAIFHYFENVGIPATEFYTTDNDEIISRQFPYFSLLIIQSKVKYNESFIN